MRFTEINLFGVYVAPMSSMMVVAWVATIGLRWFAARFGPKHDDLLASVEAGLAYVRTSGGPTGPASSPTLCCCSSLTRSRHAFRPAD